MSDSVRPHRRQPTRLPRPWDSPGKNTGSFLLLQTGKIYIVIQKVIPWHNLHTVFKNSKLILLWGGAPIFLKHLLCAQLPHLTPQPPHRENLSIFFLQMRTEAQRGKVTCPKSHRNGIAEMGRNTRIVRLSPAGSPGRPRGRPPPLQGRGAETGCKDQHCLFPAGRGMGLPL